MRFRQAFSLYPRETGRRTVWYFRTYGPDGARTVGRSTGLTSKTAARAYCEDLHRRGLLVPTADVSFGEFAEDWWLWGKCAYLRGRLELSAPGRPRVSESYAHRQRRALELHILPEFGRLSLSAIHPGHIERWVFRMRDNGLAGSSANLVLQGLHIMLKEAVRRGLLAADPTVKVRRLGEDRSPRGILSLDEARRLFAEPQFNQVWGALTMHRALNMLAATTGLRMGEIQALTSADLRCDHVHVAHSWDKRFGLGPTKTRAARDVPLTTKVAEAVRPFVGGAGYVFSANGGTRPLDATGIRDTLYQALGRIGIPIEQVRARGLVFHSWRRFANTLFRARGIPDALVRQVTGHETKEMTEHYTAFQLEHFAPVLEAQKELLG